jgi:hypothetical protein
MVSGYLRIEEIRETCDIRRYKLAKMKGERKSIEDGAVCIFV